jgi:hypothetical protein
MRDTAQGVTDLATELGQWAGLVDRGVKINLGDVRPGEAQTGAGQVANAGHEMARGLAAFAMPFGAAAKVLRGMGLGRYVTTMMAGGLADMLQDPTQGNLSTLARDLGVEGDVLRFLDSRVEEDAPAEERLRARLKQVIEGAGAGLVIDGLIGLATADRAARRAGQGAPAPAAPAAPTPAPEPSAMDRQHAATRPPEAPAPAPRRGDAGPPLTPEQRAYRAQQRARQAKERRESFRTVIAGEEPISAARLVELVEGLTGRKVLPEARRGYDGAVDFPMGAGRVPLSKMQVTIRDMDNAATLAHETGHLIHLAELGPNPRLPAAVRAELEASDDIAGATASYAPGKQEEELFATSVQMLLTEPDFFKAMHPETDAWLRGLVNSSPRLQDYIVLRLLPLALASAAGAAAMAPGEAEAGPLDRALRQVMRAAPDAVRGAARTAAPAARAVDNPRAAQAITEAVAEAVQREPEALREVPGIRAFHGSPHDFERFDIGRIGTGEGAQAYGHGLYFAEREGTAKAYRDALAPASYRVGRGDTMPAGDVFERLRSAAARGGASEARAGEVASNFLAGLDEAGSVSRYLRDYELPGGQWQAAYQTVAEEARGLNIRSNPGRMYEVNLRVDPARLLDWDKPLSEQSPAVREALTGANSHETLGSVLARAYRNPRFAGDLIGRDTATAVELSAALRAAGIQGIQYLDAGSRSAGAGSRNFVVFSDEAVEIMRKYGAAPLIIGGIGAGASE